MLDYEHPKQYIINKVKVSGIKYLDPEVVASMSGLTKGDTIMIPSDYLSSTLKTMWNQRIYSDVQILTEPVGDSVNIEIVLRERPRVYDWKIEGVRKGQMSELLETLKLKKGSELSDFVLNSSKDAIRKYFAEKGFYNADVSVRLENDTTLENVVNVFFVVDRKNRVKIGKIDFEGNTALSDRQLRRSFKKTHQKSINIFKGAKYKEKDYEEDKENLIDFYNSRGYRNATILSDSVYRINDKRLGIALKVDEGNKFYYRNVSWTGNSVYETRQLNDMLGISKGETYDKKTLHKRLGIGKHADYEDMSSISSLYQNNGYLFSSIDPGEVVVGEDSIDINVKIFEGKQAKINEVKISGNHRVNDRVIRRELYVRPGELYNRALLMQTIRQLNQMQHFDPEKTSPGIDLVPNSNELVDISFPLEEVASDKFEISGGWGSNMFVGSVGVQLNNVSLKNFFKGSEWRPYPHGQNQQLAIRGQTNGSYYKAISLNFTEPWLGGKKPNSLTVGLYYSDETDAYYAWQSGNRHFRTIGVSVGIGRRLSWPDRYFTIYNEISYQAYNLKDWSSFLVTNGTSNIFALKTVLARNSVDSPIYPRTGSEFSLSLTLTPPYSLFQKNVDYADPNLPDYKRYKWIEYHKWQFKAQWYYPLTNNNKLVLMARAEMGYLGSYNKNKPSPFEGFDVGGDGMSGYNVYGVEIVGLRGYENSALTPYTYTADGRADYARAYNKYTMEIRYPFILKPSSTIYGLVFAEGGNAFKSWKEFDPFLIKRSIGVGARIYLPIVGMLGIDWGYGFDKAVGQTERSGSQVHFIIGTQF
ncbi:MULTISPECIES: BamA/OMP85 family outer membrane protein [Alistipes]|jgi:surface antigen|uniref:BamA/OMP85 family outer membrane protein n=2 Tax=Rikenellaceae TaxID=171550 RepID=UPI001D773295|nr:MULTISPECIES: POTRA domain-containing protein [Alistipes]MBS1364390.1 BamA/TamA family outer membrane protein [Alistipes sp.]HJG75838.1 BamA/TamA family outer membrane protein [Alistipes ihumii]